MEDCLDFVADEAGRLQSRRPSFCISHRRFG